MAAEHHDTGVVDRAVADGSNVDSIEPMQRRPGSSEANSDANDEPARAGVGSNNYDHHLVDAQDFGNVRLAIGTVERSIFEMSLSDNLTGTRHIDIRLRQNSAPGNVAGTDEPGSGNIGSSSRLKITVAADEPEPDADAKYLDKMRGWFMTVAALLVGSTFQAAIQPPQWVLGALLQAEDADTLASGAPAAAPSPLSAADQPATNDVTGEARRANLYYGMNGAAFVTAMSLLLVLMLARGTSADRRAMHTVKYTMPILFLTVGFTFVAAMTTDWPRTVASFSYYAAVAAIEIVTMMGKLDGCVVWVHKLIRR